MAAASLAVGGVSFAQPASRRFTTNLVTFMIGVTVKSQAEANTLAVRHGFESVEARGQDFLTMSADDLARLRAQMQWDRLTWGAGFLPNDARADAARYDEAIKDLPAFAAGLQRAGVTRVGTWISPTSDSLTYLQNFKRHVGRIRTIGQILGDHGVRFGLEYIGTPSLRRGRRHPFIHTMAETRELLAEVGASNVGFVLDSWHWWTSGDTAADIRTLKSQEVVAVDLNDAPTGIAVDDQRDNQRELPGATGVIPITDFVAVQRRPQRARRRPGLCEDHSGGEAGRRFDLNGYGAATTRTTRDFTLLLSRLSATVLSASAFAKKKYVPGGVPAGMATRVAPPDEAPAIKAATLRLPSSTASAASSVPLIDR